MVVLYYMHYKSLGLQFILLEKYKFRPSDFTMCFIHFYEVLQNAQQQIVFIPFTIKYTLVLPYI